MAKMPNFLEFDNQAEDELNLSKLLAKIDTNKSKKLGEPMKPECQPAFCVKTKDGKSCKVFINICVSDQVEYPLLDLTEDELTTLMQSEMVDTFKIPMLLDTLKESKDKSMDNEALVIDSIINEEFYEKRVKSSLLFKTFLVTVAILAIESKYNQRELKLDKDNWIILKNKKYFHPITDADGKGELTERTKSIPIPSTSRSSADCSTSKLITEVKSTSETNSKKATLQPDNDRKLSMGEKSFASGASESNYSMQLDVKNRRLTITINLSESVNLTELKLTANEDNIRLTDGQLNKLLVNAYTPFLINCETMQAKYDLFKCQLIINASANI